MKFLEALFSQKRNKISQVHVYYFTYFYVNLCDCKNRSAFLDIKQTLFYKLAIE